MTASANTPATLTIDDGPRRVRSVLRDPDSASSAGEPQPAPKNAGARPAKETVRSMVRLEVRKLVSLLIGALRRFPDASAAVQEILLANLGPEPVA